MRAKEICTEELKCTIDIACLNTKDEADQLFPAPGIELPHPGVLAIDTVAQHRTILFNEREKPGQIANIKLSIRVHKESQFFSDRLKTRYQGRAISLVPMVIDKADTLVIGHQLLNHLSS